MVTHLTRTACWASLALCVSACAGGAIEPRDDVDAASPRDAVDVATQHDTGASVDAALPDDASVVPDDASVTPRDGAICSGNHDTVIERSEMAFPVGATVLYAVNRDGTTVDPVDTVGMMTASGHVWNYSAPVTSDQRVLDEVMPAAGHWWSSLYPDATFATVIDRATGLLGVYRVSATALELLATVSTEQNRTNLALSPAVAVLRFPLRVGATWDQTVTGTGFLNFTPITNVTHYSTHVDAAGEVWTPAGRFPALRMRTDLDQSIPLTVFRTTKRTYTFVAECWGVVARVVSVDNETVEEFHRASEYRRLGL